MTASSQQSCCGPHYRRWTEMGHQPSHQDHGTGDVQRFDEQIVHVHCFRDIFPIAWTFAMVSIAICAMLTGANP